MNARIAPPATIPGEALNHPRSLAAFRTLKLAVGGYTGFSLLTLVAVYLLRHNSALVNDTAWIRGGIVALTSLLMLSFATGTARGRRRAYLRLRIASALMLVSIAALVALPGLLPAWMRIEQGVCGLLLAGVVAIANGRHLRTMFATE
ncbi:hypothetical protein [Planotetraspora kaengkrachanensis]|uniref:Uncharacterized protein n=1 Tax=Planotetraspora kaengkrachanensis TaxID=575193 RepID=A0A8J3PWV8_9ACTN|nr:hypothetical protein [Planotetraspora kaengkrachanensis]GIG82553.1 hypothetical protein Pka01_56800 [Planotetraspora kaengkrachanensis]